MLGYHSVVYYLAVALIEMVGLNTFLQQWKRPIMAAIAALTGAGCSVFMHSFQSCLDIMRAEIHGEARASLSIISILHSNRGNEPCACDQCLLRGSQHHTQGSTRGGSRLSDGSTTTTRCTS